MAKIGYARVSTGEQNLSLQLDALTAAGCEQVYQDEGISGSKIERNGLIQALTELQPGDTLVVWKLDRLGRSLGHLCEMLDDFGKRKIEFQSLTDGIDTTTPGGKLVFHIMGALSEFESALIGERTKAGMQAAKRRGKRMGRPPALSDTQVRHLESLINSGKSQREAAELLGVSPNTVWRAVQNIKRPELVRAL